MTEGHIAGFTTSRVAWVVVVSRFRMAGRKSSIEKLISSFVHAARWPKQWPTHPLGVHMTLRRVHFKAHRELGLTLGQSRAEACV
jgi:hypothetical protein